MKDSLAVGNFVDFIPGICGLERLGGQTKYVAGHLVFITYGVDPRLEGADTILKNLK